MAHLNDFINAWTGKFIPSRGGYTGQCVSMVQKWSEDRGVGGTPVFPVPAAKDMVGLRGDAFDWIPNSSASIVPQPGDIIVWNTAVGPYGHTAIFIDGNASSFRSFDQNWPTGSAAHIQNHNYNGVVGWLRLKGQPAPQPQGEGNMTPDQEKLAYNIVLGRNPEPGAALGQRTAFGFIKDAEGELSAIRAGSIAQIKQLTDRVNEIQKGLDSANSLVQKLQDELVASGADKASLTKRVEDLQKLTEKIDNSTPTTLESFSVGELVTAIFKKIARIK